MATVTRQWSRRARNRATVSTGTGVVDVVDPQRKECPEVDRPGDIRAVRPGSRHTGRVGLGERRELELFVLRRIAGDVRGPRDLYSRVTGQIRAPHVAAIVWRQRVLGRSVLLMPTSAISGAVNTAPPQKA